MDKIPGGAKKKYPCVIQYNVKTRKAITNFDIQRWHFHTILTEILKFKIEKTFWEVSKSSTVQQ